MASMTYWLPANSFMAYSIRWLSVISLLARAAALEHLEHAVGDEEAAHHVAGGSDDRYYTQNRREFTLVLAHQDNRTHNSDGVESVGQRHQRRVQQGRR